MFLALPHVPLTLGNAIIAITEENNRLFPDRPVTERRVAISTGIMNLGSAVRGGIPMCHGAGGMAGHVRFGARTGGAPIILGTVFLLVALFFRGSISTLLRLFPASILGAILFLTGAQLALGACEMSKDKGRALRHGDHGGARDLERRHRVHRGRGGVLPRAPRVTQAVTGLAAMQRSVPPALAANVPPALRAIGHPLACLKHGWVFRKGDAVRAVFLVLEGEVRLSRFARDGSEITLHRAGRGEFFAEASLDAPRYHCNAIASRATTLLAFPADKVRALLAKDPRFARQWVALLAGQLHSARARLERVALKSAAERVLHYLRTEGKGPRCEVTLEGTVKDLAQELGLTHETLYRTLARLERDGMVGRGDNRLFLA